VEWAFPGVQDSLAFAPILASRNFGLVLQQDVQIPIPFKKNLNRNLEFLEEFEGDL